VGGGSQINPYHAAEGSDKQEKNAVKISKKKKVTKKELNELRRVVLKETSPKKT